ncbi:MAG TPA: substrate-binding domain-containing protein [Anaerolineae bacterium]|nr:substrate-binding domain-containing protein [Anaerolineae bacterium]
MAVSAPQPPPAQTRRTTIGLILRGTQDTYQFAVWSGVADAARQRDVNLVCFSGGTPHRTQEQVNIPRGAEYEHERNAIHALISPDNIDGLVILTGSLSSFVSFDEIEAFCQRFHPLPVVSIALPLPNIPSVLVDNYRGMYDAVAHLIEVHGHRRIAFIRGPEVNLEAEERYRAYREALTHYGLPLDPDLVAPGNFNLDSGIAAARLLLDQRRVDFEAIVAADDITALGAMDLLHLRGVRVPDDVAVVGFNDGEEARFAVPPLTSVRQPIYELGQSATELLLAALAGETAPAQVFKPTRLVVRNSCGCLPSSIVQAASGAVTPATAPFETTFAARREELLAQVKAELARGDADHFSEYGEQLLNAFVADVRGAGPPDLFLHTLDGLLRQLMAAERDVSAFHDLLSALRRCLLPLIDEDALRARAEDLWQQARLIIGETARQLQEFQNFRNMRYVELGMYQLGAMMMSASSIEELTDVLVDQMPWLGVKSCFLSLYDGPGAPAERSKLILAYSGGERLPLNGAGGPFPSRQLIPRDLQLQDRRYDLLVEPLHFRENHFGFIVLEMMQRNYMYRFVSKQLSDALQVTLLLLERRRTEDRLLQQAQELAHSNAELEQFTYIAAHDLQEPMRKIRAFGDRLNAKYGQTLDAQGRDYLERMRNAAARMQTLINDLRIYSRITTKAQPFAPVELGEVARGVLSDLESRIEQVNGRVELGWLPALEADPAQLRHLLQNLIGNALKFHRPGLPPVIKVWGAYLNGSGERRCEVRVEDNGIGFDEKYLNRIFQVFQRLHSRGQYEGTGMGLATCRKIVERHGGSITASSVPGQGATFIVTLPLVPPQAGS